MYYVIHIKTGKIAHEGTSKGPLRKKLKAMKNPQMYKVSKFAELVEKKAKETSKKAPKKGSKKKEVKKAKSVKGKKKGKAKKESLDI